MGWVLALTVNVSIVTQVCFLCKFSISWKPWLLARHPLGAAILGFLSFISPHEARISGLTAEELSALLCCDFFLLASTIRQTFLILAL